MTNETEQKYVTDKLRDLKDVIDNGNYMKYPSTLRKAVVSQAAVEIWACIPKYKAMTEDDQKKVGVDVDGLMRKVNGIMKTIESLDEEK